MANFSTLLVGPYRPRRELLAVSTRALADQGARLRQDLERTLRGTGYDKHPVPDTHGVTVEVTHQGTEAPADLVDLAAAVEPYLLDTLERLGLFHRAQLRGVAHHFRRDKIDGLQVSVMEIGDPFRVQ